MKIKNKSRLKSISFSVLFLFLFQALVLADDLHVYDSSRAYNPGAQTTSQLQDSFLKATRLLQQKQTLEILAEQNVDVRRVDPKSLTQIGDAVSAPVIPSLELTDPATNTYQWILSNQAQSALGLVESYPQDGNINQGFTYDQALAGIMLLKENDTVAAKKIFDFYKARWDGTGFWTVYNTQSVNGSKIEFAKILGPNAWIALFALHYYRATGDSNALDLSADVGRWISSLPHNGGGVAMGAFNPGGSPNWGQIYSIENNLDYYALLDLLSTKAPLQSDRNLFKNELTSLKQWFQTTTYDNAAGLFKRGPSNSLNDITLSLDTNTWAISAIGIDGVKNLMNWNDQQLSDFVVRIENNFAVQADGSFGGNVLTSKGFDFAGTLNAQITPRVGIKWVEGTGQMILVYKQLIAHYKEAGNAALVTLYTGRAAYFESLNASSLTPDGQSYFYTDSPGTKIFWDVAFFNASPGPAVPATAWMYFSLNAINPFDPYGKVHLDAPVSFSASTDSSLSENLSMTINTALNATVTLNARNYQGIFDPSSLIVSVSNVTGGSPDILDENWELSLNETFASGLPVYTLASLTKLIHYADTSLFNYTYTFSTDGFLVSDLYYSSLGTETHITTRDYSYEDANGSVMPDVTSMATFINGVYLYGSRFDYDYTAAGQVSSILVTMETRDDPLVRILQTHQYLFGAGGVEILYLGRQSLPVS